MSSYWWECESCGDSTEFPQITQSKGIVHYIRDVLAPSDWDQSHLLLKCKKCGKYTSRITYDFPRAEKETLRVVSIVGLGNDSYLPMMWETYPMSNIRDRWFDFKYINGRSIFGLTKPAVLSKKELQAILKLYNQKTGRTLT